MLPPSVTAWIVSILLVSCRVGGAAMALPYFSSEVAPLRVRLLLVLTLSVALAMALPAPVTTWSLGALASATLVELGIGATFGLTARIILAAAEMAGELMGMSAGFSFDSVVNPLVQSQTGPFARLSTALVGLLFFATDSHHEIIRGLGRSLTKLPAGSIAFQSRFTSMVVDALPSMFQTGLQLALPIVATVTLTHVGLGLLGRVVPQLNLWSVGFLVAVFVALGAIALIAPQFGAAIAVLVRQSAEQFSAELGQ